MKRKTCFVLSCMLIFAGLFAFGCGKKQDATAPAEKPAASSAVNMQEGKWEITSTIEMQGMPAGMVPPQTFTTCLSKKDYVPKGEQQQDCMMQDTRVDGNTVTWTVVCKDSRGTGRVTYAGTNFDGVIETVMKDEGKEQKATMTMKGRHIGPCQ